MSSTSPAFTLAPGARPLPGYELGRLLGRGGFGEAWSATGPGGVEVALKFVRLEGKAGDVELRALDVIRNIRHPNLLGLHGVWDAHGYLILGQELGDRTLMDRLKEAVGAGLPGLPADELLEYMADAARGLDHLNQKADIQHRDVKPQNLFLVGGGVKVADFGLVKLMEKTVISTTAGGMTPAYAPKELFEGKVTKWTDQYSLAVTYVQLRTNRMPFGGSYAEVVAGHMFRDPNLSLLGSAGERTVLGRALAKTPQERWPNCRAFVDALRQAVGGVTPPGVVMNTPRQADESHTTDPVPVPVTPPAKVVPVVPLPQPALQAHAAGPGLLDCTGLDGASEAEVQAAQREWAAYLGRKVEEEVEIADGVTMTFVLIPPGRFRMGSPADEAKRKTDETLHTVTLTRPYYLGKYVVTQRQYEALIGENPSKFRGADLPVERVSWEACLRYGQKLTSIRGDRWSYRLPTEAEWEYACRGGPSSRAFGIRDGRSLDSAQANFDGGYPYGGAAKGTCLRRTTRVGSYQPNAFGLYDMHGNVWEWCTDWYTPDLGGDSTTDPAGPATGSLRVRRGGGWNDSARNCRSAGREGDGPGYREHYLGFRLARVPSKRDHKIIAVLPAYNAESTGGGK